MLKLEESDFEINKYGKETFGDVKTITYTNISNRKLCEEVHRIEIKEANNDPEKLYKAHIKFILNGNLPTAIWLKAVCKRINKNIFGEPFNENDRILFHPEFELDGKVYETKYI